jgi:hypothetical protein
VKTDDEKLNNLLQNRFKYMLINFNGGSDMIETGRDTLAG